MGFEPPIRRDARAAVLARTRENKMAESPGSFVRGSTEKFYEWLRGLKHGALPEGPEIWICGNCHQGNLGPTADERGKVGLLLRDFDQTVVGNPVHDLLRLALSLASSARGSDLPGLVTAKMIGALMEGYESAYDPRAEAASIPKTIRRLLKKSRDATWSSFAEANIENETPTLPIGKRFWPLRKDERREIDALFETEAIADLATRLRSRDKGDKVKVLDAAFWRKGCSSLGRLRYAVLLSVGEGRAREFCLMDVKEAVAPALKSDAVAMPRDPAERVMEGARRLSPALGDRMLPAKLGGSPVFVRELLPQDMKIEIEQLSQEEAAGVARYLGHVVGKAHAGQLDAQARKSWLTELRRGPTSSPGAPTWLWRNVVDLLAIHDSAYLEHCRRVASRPGVA